MRLYYVLGHAIIPSWVRTMRACQFWPAFARVETVYHCQIYRAMQRAVAPPFG